jgi:hypothetical protein
MRSIIIGRPEKISMDCGGSKAAMLASWSRPAARLEEHHVLVQK